MTAVRKSVTLPVFRTDRAAVERSSFPANIGEFVDRSAERFADRLLWHAIDGSERLSYRQFQIATLKTAGGLRAVGIGQGSHVGIMLPNISAFFIAWIALCRLGSVTVMINTGSTPRELAIALREGKISTLIIDHEYLGVLENLTSAERPAGLRIIVIAPSPTNDPLSYAAVVDHAVPTDIPSIDPDVSSTIQFTSGSTGMPKGCMLSHRYWMTIGRVRATSGPAPEHMIIDTPFYYMGPLWRFMMALDVGATIHVAKRFSLSGLLDRWIDNKINFAVITTPVAKLPDDRRYRQTDLSWLATYGLSKDLHAGLEDRFGVPIREIYGMTEIGAGLFMPIEDSHMVGSGSCGKPAPFREFRIVDGKRDVGAGETGELWVSGPGLFSGYYGRSEATAESFDGRWFKTGDLFRQDRDGYFYMLGRIKDVIRRSGENISASEVESVINSMPGILESAAVPVPSDLRGEELKVYLVLAPDSDKSTITPERVLDYCRARLTPFKVPRYFQFIDEMPHTSAGKINKTPLKVYSADLRSNSYDATDGIWR